MATTDRDGAAREQSRLMIELFHQPQYHPDLSGYLHT
jgi:hypothetical protein